MNNCPFCKEPIESYWTYCRNCNKPLITNINDVVNKSREQVLANGAHGGPA